ncbi:MAG: hypothetical protein ACKOC9_07535, partial [Alphaproteobacteria bacterium]
MPETPEGLLARLIAAGIAAETRHHPAVFPGAARQGLRGTLPGGHTKTLFRRPAKVASRKGPSPLAGRRNRFLV